GDGVRVGGLVDSHHRSGAAHPIVPSRVELAEQQRELDDLPQMHHGPRLEEDTDLADVPSDPGAGLEFDGHDDVITTRLTAVGPVGGPHRRRLYSADFSKAIVGDSDDS